MPKRGQTQPYKLRYQYSGQTVRTIAYSSADDAEREIVGMLDRGARVELLCKTDHGLNVVGVYDANIQHKVTVTDSDSVVGYCSCGRVLAKQPWEKTPGADHVERFTPLVDDNEDEMGH